MALSLTRKDGESIVLDLPNGDRITIALELTRNRQAKLHIKAPLEIKIWRGELTPPAMSKPDSNWNAADAS